MTNTTVKQLILDGIIEEPMDGNHGEIHPTAKDYVSEGIPFIMASDIENSNVNFNTCKYITEKTASGLRKGFAKNGDVLLTHKATIGRTAILKNLKTDYVVLTPQVTYYRVLNDDVLNYKYLKYYFDSPEFQYIVKKRAGAGSTRAYIGILQQQSLPVLYPDIDLQTKIADTLSLLDEKIFNNNAINTELEAMAKIIYDYWFLQFEFPDKNGKPYKSAGGKMVWSNELKREIPEGWEVGNLYDIADFINGLACQKYRPISDDKKLPVVKIVEMHDGITDSTEFVREDIPEKNIIDDGDILFSWSATLEAMLWTGGKAGLNQHIFKVVPKDYAKYYVFMQLSSYIINFIQMAEARKTTMGHITTDHLKQSRIVLPPKKLADIFQNKVEDFFQMVINNNEESRELASLRDFLLPLLMNGQVGFAN